MTMHVNTHGNVYKYKGIRFEKRHPQKCKNLLQRYSGDAECMKNTPENHRKGNPQKRKHLLQRCSGDSECLQIHWKATQKRAQAKVQAPIAEVLWGCRMHANTFENKRKEGTGKSASTYCRGTKEKGREREKERERERER
jgi:hypothetical protein